MLVCGGRPLDLLSLLLARHDESFVSPLIKAPPR